MSVQLERVQRRAEYVRTQLRELRRIARDMDLPAFLADPDAPAAVRYRLQTAVEALIDIAFHLSAKMTQHAPQDASDAFATMTRAGILDIGALPRYQQMLRFRNRVVHGYLEVDDEILYGMLTGPDLQDIESALGRFEEAAARAVAETRETRGPAGHGEP